MLLVASWPSVFSFLVRTGGCPLSVPPSSVSRLRAPSPCCQVNSDGRPTQEYFDFLLGTKRSQKTEDCPSVIVGSGRIGTMIREFGSRRGFDDVVVKRGDPIPHDHPGPIYVCTQTEDLEAVIKATPEAKKDDLIFLQDGMLEPVFQKYGLYGPTQISLWIAQMRLGGKPVDGVHSAAADGLTQVHGKWAGAVAMRMGTGGLLCREVMDRDGRRGVLERLVFVSAYNLVGAVHGGLTVGEVALHHREEVGAMCRELASFIRYTLSVSLFSGIDDRLNAYARHMEFLPTAIKDFRFRNGYFYRYALMAGTRTTADGRKIDVPDTTPIHTEYLLFARDNGIIPAELLDSVKPMA